MRETPVEDFYFLRIGAMWAYFRSETLAFWMICCYLVIEYVRPQKIFPVIDILPWAQTFLLFSICGMFLDKSIKWVSSFANILLILFFLAILISGYFAYYPEISKESRMNFFGWFVIYFLIILIVNDIKRFYIFFLIFFLASAKIAIGTSKIWIARGFSFTTWGLMGPPGYFQNSGELSIQMVILFPVAFYFYQTLWPGARWQEKIVLALCCIAPVLTILGASSRGSQLAIAVVFLLMFYKKIFRPKAMILIGVVIFAGLFLLPDEQKERFDSMGNDKSSQQRLLYWEHGIDMILEHPVLGVGYFNFPKYYSVYYPEDMLYESAQLPHNIFIQVGTDMGFTGLTIFLLILAVCYFTYKKIQVLARVHEDRQFYAKIATGLWFGIVGFVVAGQFVTVTYYPFLWISLALLVSLRNILQKENKQRAKSGLK